MNECFKKFIKKLIGQLNMMLLLCLLSYVFTLEELGFLYSVGKERFVSYDVERKEVFLYDKQNDSRHSGPKRIKMISNENDDDIGVFLYPLEKDTGLSFDLSTQTKPDVDLFKIDKNRRQQHFNFIYQPNGRFKIKAHDYCVKASKNGLIRSSCGDKEKPQNLLFEWAKSPNEIKRKLLRNKNRGNNYQDNYPGSYRDNYSNDEYFNDQNNYPTRHSDRYDGDDYDDRDRRDRDDYRYNNKRKNNRRSRLADSDNDDLFMDDDFDDYDQSDYRRKGHDNRRGHRKLKLKCRKNVSSRDYYD